MKQPVVIVGVGELGSVFVRGFLCIGHPVYPITRGMDFADEARQIPEPAMVLVAVGEDDLHAVLRVIPTGWRDRLALMQNELLPQDWNAHELPHPTVIVVWFEKKPGMDVRVVIPSVVFGPHASLIESALNALNIPVRRVGSPEEILIELVHKNLHILTMNISGLVTGGTLGGLIKKHRALAVEVAGEVLDIQEHLVGAEIPRGQLIDKMWETFAVDSEQPTMGRTAPARLERAIGAADQAGLAVPRLREIHAKAMT